MEKLFQAAGVPRRSVPALESHVRSRPMLAASGDGPRIVSPKKELIYHVRVGAADDEVLNLEATAETSRDHLRWFVDAAYVGESAPSSALLWKPQPGRHIIRAVDDSGRADSREIQVTTVE